MTRDEIYALVESLSRYDLDALIEVAAAQRTRDNAFRRLWYGSAMAPWPKKERVAR